MDEAGGVDGGQGLGRLAEQPQAVALQAAVAADEQGIQVRAPSRYSMTMYGAPSVVVPYS